MTSETSETTETTETKIEVTSSEASAYLVYPGRFYVVFVYAFLCFNQNLIWLTFSPIARSAEEYYNITDNTIDLLLNWGSIISIPCLPLTSILLSTPNGIRYCVLLLAITDFLATVIRIIPSIILKSTASNFNAVALPCIHIGQILNAACGPLVMAPVSQLSSVWFAPHERTRATTVAIIANNNIGAAVGFLISPYIVALPQHVPRLLYVHLGFAFVACVLTLVYFPARPPSPPSMAAELLIRSPTSSESSHNWRHFLKDIWICLSKPAFLSLSLAGGLLYGVFNAWPSLYDILLEPEHYSEEQAGWFGFGSSVAGIFGGIVFSYIADKRRFQHSLKTLLMISFIGCLTSMVWFDLCVSSIFYDKRILPSNAITIGLSTGLAGLFAGAASPLVYEALAEIMYPLPESLPASIFIQWVNVITVVFLFVAPNRDKMFNFLVLVAMAAATLLGLLTPFTYRRRDEDERKRIEKEQNQIIGNNNLNEVTNSYNSSDRPRNIIINGRQYGTFAETNPAEGLENEISGEDVNISRRVRID